MNSPGSQASINPDTSAPPAAGPRANGGRLSWHNVVAGVWLLGALLVILLTAQLPVSSVVPAPGFAYDVSVIDRVEGHDVSAASYARAQFSDARVLASFPSVESLGAATTPLARSVATNNVVGGLDDLAARRMALGAAPAGPGVSPTLSRLDVDGMAPIYGTSGHGQTVTLRVNPISRTHAETDVLQQLSNLGGANGAKATIYIDYPGGLCGACGRSGAVRSMAGQVGISELTVVWPGGSTVIVP